MITNFSHLVQKLLNDSRPRECSIQILHSWWTLNFLEYTYSFQITRCLIDNSLMQCFLYFTKIFFIVYVYNFNVFYKNKVEKCMTVNE